MEPRDTMRVARALARRDQPRAASASRTPVRRTPLPSDVLADAARRLRVVALLYATVFVIVGPVTALSSSAPERDAFFTNPMRAGSSLIAIAAALLVAASTRRAAALSPRTVLAIGLLFEVVGSYGIAAARYLDPAQQATAPPVVSWVAVWILLFATVIPSPPGLALAAAIASATAVPVTAVISAALRGGGGAPGLWLLGLQLSSPTSRRGSCTGSAPSSVTPASLAATGSSSAARASRVNRSMRLGSRVRSDGRILIAMSRLSEASRARYLTHSAGANPGNDLVSPNPRSDHSIGILLPLVA
jgi:hypothetical protein